MGDGVRPQPASALPENCPSCDKRWEVDGYSRVIGVVINDRVARWQCPDCLALWDRDAWKLSEVLPDEMQSKIGREALARIRSEMKTKGDA